MKLGKLTMARVAMVLILWSPVFLTSADNPESDYKSENELASTSWFTNIEQAQQAAIEHHKPILMFFSGSDWCKPCIMLKTNVLESEAFTAFANESLILLELDFPYRKKNLLSKEQTEHNEQLAEKYNPNGQFPYLVMLDEKGELLEKFTFKKNATPEECIAFIQTIINTQNSPTNENQP